VLRCLGLALACGIVLLVALAAGLAGWGRGVDWQRDVDRHNVCRGYASPAAVTGFACP
jgi:hypothetical protein